MVLSGNLYSWHFDATYSELLIDFKQNIGSGTQPGSTPMKSNFQFEILSSTRATLDEERVIVGGDLNGHIGRSREGIERIHG